MANTVSKVAFAAAVCVSASQTFAADLQTVKTLSTALAIEAAKAAIDACSELGKPVSASVVTKDGVTKVILAGDGAGPVATETSRRKAYTAAVIGASTRDFIEILKGVTGGTFPSNIDPNIILFIGGVPVKADGTVIGAIGVGGSEEKFDEQCALAGISKIADRLK